MDQSNKGRCRRTRHELYYTAECRSKIESVGRPQEVYMAEKSKQPKEPKKKPQKTLLEKRKEKREKAATKHED